MEEKHAECQCKKDRSPEIPEQWTAGREPIKSPSPSTIFTTWDEQLPGSRIKLKKLITEIIIQDLSPSLSNYTNTTFRIPHYSRRSPYASKNAARDASETRFYVLLTFPDTAAYNIYRY